MQVSGRPKCASLKKAFILFLAFVLFGCDRAKPSIVSSSFSVCTTDSNVSATMMSALLDAGEYQIAVGNASVAATITSQLDRSDQIKEQDLKELTQEAKLLWPQSLTSSFRGTVIYGLSGRIFIRFHPDQDVVLIDRIGKNLIRCPRGGL
ncbi:MAG: hypothetical protein EOP50_10320 [Sphingobacteriales bacterium]|nr:MAG: hypothetical protein EOP50_10320 [Sphingobacteriales bacterium]